MPKNDREVFEYFASDVSYEQELDYLAFSSYIFSKFEWIDKYTSEFGVAPDEAEVEKWIRGLSDSRLGEIRQQAVRVFRVAAREFMAEPMKQAADRAVARSIHAEVKTNNERTFEEVKRTSVEVRDYVSRATSFRSNFIPNIMTGFIASIVFSIVLILMNIIVTRDPSPFALWKRIFPGG